MTKRTCECNITVTEGVFGEIYAGKSDSGSNKSTVLAEDSETWKGDKSYESGDCRCSVDEKPKGPIKIKSYTMQNETGMSVQVITWGATIVSLKFPDKYGDLADVVLGFDDMKSYLDPTINQFIGCVLGRCANRIKDGKFSLKNDDYELSKNEGNRHHLHGGTNGFGRQIWESFVEDNCAVVMSYLSEDGEEGYPGAVLATVRFELTHDNRLKIGMRATTSKPTIVNLSHGSLFNLAGHAAGEQEVKAHRVSLNCDRWTFSEYVDPIPTGAIRGVGGTVMDLRVPRLLRDIIEYIPPGEGFDHNFCVIKDTKSEISYVARVLHAKSGRYLEVYSNMPGVQLYTGGRLPPCPVPELEPRPASFEHEPDLAKTPPEDDICESPSVCEDLHCSGLSLNKTIEYLPGKSKAKYKKFGAFSIQPQGYPNAINIEHFPCTSLRPGEVYNHEIVYKFGIQLGGYM